MFGFGFGFRVRIRVRVRVRVSASYQAGPPSGSYPLRAQLVVSVPPSTRRRTSGGSMGCARRSGRSCDRVGVGVGVRVRVRVKVKVRVRVRDRVS